MEMGSCTDIFFFFFLVTGPAETQIQNMPSACAGYQLARDPVSGQIMLIPANQIGKNFQEHFFLAFTLLIARFLVALLILFFSYLTLFVFDLFSSSCLSVFFLSNFLKTVFVN